MILESKFRSLGPKTMITSLSCLEFLLREGQGFILLILIKEEFGPRMKRVITLLSMLMETQLKKCLCLLILIS